MADLLQYPDIAGLLYNMRRQWERTIDNEQIRHGIGRRQARVPQGRGVDGRGRSGGYADQALRRGGVWRADAGRRPRAQAEEGARRRNRRRPARRLRASPHLDDPWHRGRGDRGPLPGPHRRGAEVPARQPQASSGARDRRSRRLQADLRVGRGGRRLQRDPVVHARADRRLRDGARQGGAERGARGADHRRVLATH